MLVHGATGGMGLAALQVAKVIGAVVVATGGSDDKLQVHSVCLDIAECVNAWAAGVLGVFWMCSGCVITADVLVQVVRSLGAHHTINYNSTPKFAKQVKALTGGRGADVVFDPVGGASEPDDQ